MLESETTDEHTRGIVQSKAKFKKRNKERAGKRERGNK